MGDIFVSKVGQDTFVISEHRPLCEMNFCQREVYDDDDDVDDDVDVDDVDDVDDLMLASKIYCNQLRSI